MPATYDLDALVAAFPVGFGPTEGDGDAAFTVLINKFGDGQSQRARYGLNNTVRGERYTWTELPLQHARDLRDFLVARGNDQAFLWTPPDGAETQRQWLVVGKVGHRYVSGGQAMTVFASFEETFDL